MPWLQDFSLGVTYGPTQVCDQIRAARAAGANEFLLWDPEVTYTVGGICATAKMPATGTAKVPRAAEGRAGPAVPRLHDPRRGPADGAGRPPSPAGSAPPNELGQIPVLMHHQISNDESNVYDLSANEFRAELQRLWKDGFVPITASALVNAKIDIPKDRRPVVMTFDDGTKSQFALLPGRERRPGHRRRDHDGLRPEASGLQAGRHLLRQRRTRSSSVATSPTGCAG